MNNPPTVLLVDDDAAFRHAMIELLTAAGHVVTAAATATEAIEKIEGMPELVLLDLGLPDRDGLELLPIITHRFRASVIVVSGRSNADEKVAALDLGAVDYVTKPFDSDELLARMRVAQRSRAALCTSDLVIAGDVTICLAERRVTRAGEEVHLTAKEYGVLAELARFPGRLVTHTHLLHTVWPHHQAKQRVYLRLIIRGLRQKLEADPANPQLILNEMGMGYRILPSTNGGS